MKVKDLKEATETFESEMYTLGRYLMDKDMKLLHGKRFSKMIFAMRTALRAFRELEVRDLSEEEIDEAILEFEWGSEYENCKTEGEAIIKARDRKRGK